MRDATGVRPVRVGVNLLFLTPARVSGTATYAWSLLSRLQHRPELHLVLFAQEGYVDPSIDPDRVEIITCPGFSTTPGRVLWEHLVLPYRSRSHHLNVMWSPGYVAPRLTSGARVVTVHDLYYVRVPAAVPFVQRQYYSIGIPGSVRHCNAVLAVSANTADDLAKEIPSSVDKVTVVHQAARSDLVDLDTPPAEFAEPYFLQVASVTRNKNVDTVARAAIALRNAGREFRVRVVGEDPYGLLAETMTRPGATDVLVPMGEVPLEELAGLYRGAVATINPSVYEGFGLPVLEAQALGVPVISSRGGSLPEVAGDGALYFDHDSPDQLEAAMARLLDDPDERAAMTKRGLENAGRFSWDRAADETADVLIHTGRPR